MRTNNFIYLDNAATTKPNDEVAALFMESEKENFGNPNSIHALGIKNAKNVQNGLFCSFKSGFPYAVQLSSS